MGDRGPSLSSWFWSSTPFRAPEALTTASASTITPKDKGESQESNEVKNEEPQATSTKANEETKKEPINDSLSPRILPEAQIIEKPDQIPTKPDGMQTEKAKTLDEKVKPSASLLDLKPITHARTSQPRNKSMISDTRPTSIKDDDVSTLINQTAIEDPTRVLSEGTVSLITLAGENRGASMQMGTHILKGELPVNILRSYKIEPDKTDDSRTNGPGNSKANKRGDANDAENQPTEKHINNINIQGINNSIVLNCSVNERDPGVHMNTTHVQPIEPTTEKMPIAETRKAEFNMARGDKRTYEPTIRRRCLRGLMMESSDTDEDNPKKARRHGCRVGCKETSKDNKIDL